MNKDEFHDLLSSLGLKLNKDDDLDVVLNLYILQVSDKVTELDLDRIKNLEFSFGISAEQVFKIALEAIELAKAELL